MNKIIFRQRRFSVFHTNASASKALKLFLTLGGTTRMVSSIKYIACRADDNKLAAWGVLTIIGTGLRV